MMSTSERRLKTLQIAAQMNRRVTKEDPVMSAKDLVEYAAVLNEWAFNNGRSDLQPEKK